MAPGESNDLEVARELPVVYVAFVFAGFPQAGGGEVVDEGGAEQLAGWGRLRESRCGVAQGGGEAPLWWQAVLHVVGVADDRFGWLDAKPTLAERPSRTSPWARTRRSRERGHSGCSLSSLATFADEPGEEVGRVVWRQGAFAGHNQA